MTSASDFPTCSTCKHLLPEIEPYVERLPGRFRHAATCSHPDLEQYCMDDNAGGFYDQRFTVPSLSYGCLLHSDLTEAGA